MMKAVIQRVKRAEVEVKEAVVGSIGNGIVALVGVEKGDEEKDADRLAEKIATLRIFEDVAGKMNLSLLDCGGEILSISQFTLAGNCAKGRRPSFDSAAAPETARPLYDYFNARLASRGITVATGVFQAEMQVTLVNDGPVTFFLDTRQK